MQKVVGSNPISRFWKGDYALPHLDEFMPPMAAITAGPHTLRVGGEDRLV